LALQLWSDTGVFPLVNETLIGEDWFGMSLLSGEPVGPASSVGAKRMDSLTDSVCDLWSGWQREAIESASLGPLSDVIARRVRWAWARLDGTERAYTHLLERIPLMVASLGGGSYLCHGDLSVRNLMVDTSRRGSEVLVLDPAAGVGDSLIDLAHWSICSGVGNDGEAIENTLVRIVKRTGVDETRLRSWARISAIVESNLAPPIDNAATRWLVTYGAVR
jgi:aminoglycoside phosphotransferase (APT) family kinase protein